MLIYRRDIIKIHLSIASASRGFPSFFMSFGSRLSIFLWSVKCHQHFWLDLVDFWSNLLMKMSLIFLATGIKKSLTERNFTLSGNLLCIVNLDLMFFETDTCRQSSPIIANMITNIAQILRLRPWHFSTWGLADDAIVVTLEVAVLGFPNSDQ